MRQPSGIHKVTVGHAQARSGFVHHVGEGVFTAGNVLSQRNAGVVTGLNDYAMQQVIYRGLAIERQEHSGATRRCTTGAPGMLTDWHQILLTDLAFTNFQSRNVSRHQLGQTRGGQPLITIVFHQYLARRRIHQHIRLGGELRGCGHC